MLGIWADAAKIGVRDGRYIWPRRIGAQLKREIQ